MKSEGDAHSTSVYKLVIAVVLYINTSKVSENEWRALLGPTVVH